jgi:hypothetical protein
MSNLHDDLPDVSTVAPLDLAREAILHHAGANALVVHAGPEPSGRATRELYQAEQPTGGPWIAVDPGPRSLALDIKRRWPDGQDRTDRMYQTIARVFVNDDGKPEVQTFGTMGKAEIGWANATLIARMREREPLIAAECVRLAAEVDRLQAELAAARGTA